MTKAEDKTRCRNQPILIESTKKDREDEPLSTVGQHMPHHMHCRGIWFLTWYILEENLSIKVLLHHLS